jgi:hypothetical protein
VLSRSSTIRCIAFKQFSPRFSEQNQRERAAAALSIKLKKENPWEIGIAFIQFALGLSLKLQIHAWRNPKEQRFSHARIRFNFIYLDYYMLISFTARACKGNATTHISSNFFVFYERRRYNRASPLLL